MSLNWNDNLNFSMWIKNSMWTNWSNSLVLILITDSVSVPFSFSNGYWTEFQVKYTAIRRLYCIAFVGSIVGVKREENKTKDIKSSKFIIIMGFNWNQRKMIIMITKSNFDDQNNINELIDAFFTVSWSSWDRKKYEEFIRSLKTIWRKLKTHRNRQINELSPNT